jgi:small subunit ribosomal protein S5
MDNYRDNKFDEKIVQINRVSKKTKGGNKVRFAALVVVGDRQGKVGVGLGKSADVANAIIKAVSSAKTHMIEVPIVNETIPHRIQIKDGAAVVLLKPAPKGTGLIAGGAVRSVVEAAGIRNISSKILGTSNKANNVYATFEALKKLKLQNGGNK